MQQHPMGASSSREGYLRACKDPPVPDSPLHEPVLQWYAERARDLPWRAPGTTPWAVLVSEVMLQQTPVARVEPVFRD